MARDDRLKKVQEAGADFLETARSRAEEFLRELARAGDSTQGRAQGAFDDLVEGSRKGTEQILSTIRTEVAAQLGLLGLATRADLADLEARLRGSGSAKAAPAKKTAAHKTTAAGKTAARKTTARKTTAAKATAAKTTAAKATSKAAAPAKKAAAKKTTARKTTARKTTAKRAPAKKAAG